MFLRNQTFLNDEAATLHCNDIQFALMMIMTAQQIDKNRQICKGTLLKQTWGSPTEIMLSIHGHLIDLHCILLFFMQSKLFRLKVFCGLETADFRCPIF